MYNLTKLLCSLLLTLTVGYVVAGENVVVIVNEANQQAISQADVKNIYSDQIITWENGNKISAFELPARSTAREVFSSQVL